MGKTAKAQADTQSPSDAFQGVLVRWNRCAKASAPCRLVSSTLLVRHERFKGCPVLAFEQSRQGFRIWLIVFNPTCC